ncbi:MAG: dihydrofolate reductase family protein [Pseudomonadales bacterium]
MTTGHVSIAASLDGFIARRDGNLDWLMKQTTKGEDHGYNEFMDSVDGLIMGRGTFEKVLTFDEWSYNKQVVVQFTHKANRKSNLQQLHQHKLQSGINL